MKKLSLRSPFLSAALLAVTLAPMGAWAQATTPATPAPMTTMEKPAMKDAAEGEVRKIDKDAKKVTLKHGPIKSMDMPGMTMVFQVKDATLLDKLAMGDKIMFTAAQDNGAMIVTGIEKMTPK